MQKAVALTIVLNAQLKHTLSDSVIYC